MIWCICTNLWCCCRQSCLLQWVLFGWPQQSHGPKPFGIRQHQGWRFLQYYPTPMYSTSRNDMVDNSGHGVKIYFTISKGVMMATPVPLNLFSMWWYFIYPIINEFNFCQTIPGWSSMVKSNHGSKPFGVNACLKAALQCFKISCWWISKSANR